MLDFYDFYRVHLNPTSDLRNQYVGDCPFCNKKEHFFVNPESGMFDCKKCGTEGNHLTFITEYHKLHLESTDDGKYQELASSRPGITAEVLRRVRFAWDSANNRWLVPYQNGSEFLNNLGVFVPSQGFRIFKGPGLPLKLYRPIHTKTFTDNIVVCEGEWDLLALLPILEEMAPDYSLCSVPGSNSFKDEYVSLFHTKNVHLMYDKDEAGKKGIAKAVRKLEGVASSIKFLKWDTEEDFNDANGESGGKDIRDFICHHQHLQNQSTSKRKPHLPNLIWTTLESNFVTPESDSQGGGGYLDAKYTLPPVEKVESWDELISTFRGNLYLTPGNEYAIATCFATILSPYFPGEPLWLFLIGPPSCLSGDNTVKINRAGKTFTISLKDLYHRFHGGVAGGKIWDSNIETFIQQRNEDGTVRLAKVHEVMYSGTKVVYELVTEQGHTIKASADHKFMLHDGSWVRLKDLHIGDLLLSNQGRSNRGTKKRKSGKSVCGLINHPHASKRKEKRSDGWTCLQHRLVVEAEMNNLSYDEYIEILRYDLGRATCLKYLPSDVHVHHKDRDNHNNELSNLEALKYSEHFKHHCETDNFTSHVLEHCKPDRIISIKEIGVEDVYDLSVDDPHNFLCEGIVVHNSGKTTIIESFGDSNIYCDAQSQISARMLVSGYKTPDGKDISYLPTLNGRTLMIKDFTTVLSMGGHEQEELYGILRDAFDGSFRKQYGNNQKRIYKDLKFGLIAGVTKAIHGDNRSSLGERFLKIEYLEKEEFCEMSHITSALSGMGHKEERTKTLMEHSLGYVDHLINNLPSELPELDEQFTFKMSHLAMLVARLRAQVERRRDDSLLYRPEWEIASRLAVQFKKMSQCLMVVYGIKQPNNHLYNTIRKLALDSCIPFNVEFAKRMYEYPQGITRNDLSYHLQLPSTNVHRLLTDLQQLGLIQVSKSVSTGPGRKMELYHLSPEISKLWCVGIDTDLEDKEIPPEPLPEQVELPRRKRILRKPIDV